MRFPQFRLALIVALVAAAAAVTGPSQAATLKLRGIVGPGFTIQLKQGFARSFQVVRATLVSRCSRLSRTRRANLGKRSPGTSLRD